MHVYGINFNINMNCCSEKEIKLSGENEGGCHEKVAFCTRGGLKRRGQVCVKRILGYIYIYIYLMGYIIQAPEKACKCLMESLPPIPVPVISWLLTKAKQTATNLYA